MADSLVKDAALGFRVWHGAPSRMPKSHVHGDVECNFVVQGRTHYFLGGRFVDVLPGRLSIFWGGTPHRLIRSEQGTTLFWMTLPLTWFMRCRLPAHVMQQLLAGRMLSDASPPLALLDTLMLQRWAQDFSPRSTTRESALLEIEARLQRLSGGAQRTSAPLADAGHVEILAAFMGDHFAEDVSVKDIADSADLHPVYAMTLFKKACGMSIWEYLTRLRIGHAQRLLLSTDQAVTQIALASGFNTPGRFYEAFAKYAGVTPHKYRSRNEREG